MFKKIIENFKSNVIRNKKETENLSPISSKFKHVHLLDTSIASDNIGDEIIVESCKKFIFNNFRNAYISTSSSHDGLEYASTKLAEDADIVFLMGTNALSAFNHIDKKYIWMLKNKDIKTLNGKLVLLGVGANSDTLHTSHDQIKNIQALLKKNTIHSVRDNTGKKILDQAELQVRNTSCPTLWASNLPDTRKDKSDAVVFTLTAHKPSSSDKFFVQTIRKNYSKVYFWPQQPRDFNYLKKINEDHLIEIIPPNLISYDDLLKNEKVDVVGTRLHGTIRGLHFGQRSLVVIIDNRARDISMEVGLPSICRSNLEYNLQKEIFLENRPPIILPKQEIIEFSRQFSS